MINFLNLKFKRINHGGFIYKSNKIYLCFSAATHSNDLIIDVYYGNENENAILLASTSTNKCINKFFNDDDFQSILYTINNDLVMSLKKTLSIVNEIANLAEFKNIKTNIVYSDNDLLSV